MSRRLSVNDIERLENTAAAVAIITASPSTDADSVLCHAVRTTTNALSDLVCT